MKINNFIWTFFLGQTEAFCQVKILDDTVYEHNEYFRLVLGDPLVDSNKTAKLGKYKEVTVKITNEKDRKFSVINYKTLTIKKQCSDLNCFNFTTSKAFHYSLKVYLKCHKIIIKFIFFHQIYRHYI